MIKCQFDSEHDEGYDKNVDDILSDQNLWTMYEKQPSVSKRLEKLGSIFLVLVLMSIKCR